MRGMLLALATKREVYLRECLSRLLVALYLPSEDCRCDWATSEKPNS